MRLMRGDSVETLKEIKTDICDMLVYCDVISSKDSTTQSKVNFTHLMGNVAERIKVKCDKLEKELENEQAHRESCG